MSGHFQRYSLRKAREEAEKCLLALAYNHAAVYLRVASALSRVPLIQSHVQCGGKKSHFDQRGLFKCIDIEDFAKKGIWDAKDRSKIIFASPKIKQKMIRELVDFCSEVIAISAKAQLS